MSDFYYKFKSLELLQFATLSDQFEMDRTKGHTEVSFRYEPQVRTLDVRLSFMLVNNEDNTPLLKATLKSGFEIKEESLEQLINNDEIVFPSSFLAHLVGLTYSSLRGIIFAKTEHTAFESFILPAQDIQSYIKEPFVCKK